MPHHDYSDSDDEPGPSRATTTTHSPRANTRVKLTVRPRLCLVPHPLDPYEPRSPCVHYARAHVQFARPNITHLMNDPSPLTEAERPARSSLSPPPPLTLRLGPRPSASSSSNMPPAASSSKAGSIAHYSDSSDENESKPPPSKKAKKTKSKAHAQAASHSPTSTASGPGDHVVPGPKRSKYDWLQPSTVGASHHGPPERAGSTSIAKSNSGSGSGSGGWAPGEGIIAQVAGENEPRPEKKISLKVGKPPGPGKAWRKGVKKWVGPAMEVGVRSLTSSGQPRPNAVHAYTPEGFSVPHSPAQSASAEQVHPSRVLSPDAASGESLTAASFSSLTPDIYGSNAAPAPAALISRPPSPPFILADAAKLGIPVFKQPIAPPKFNLTLFPKVSPWFAPLNGGDVGTFPRKEHVRKWGQNQKTFVGIGGGTLKFQTWTKDGKCGMLEICTDADFQVLHQS